MSAGMMLRMPQEGSERSRVEGDGCILEEVVSSKSI